MRKILPIACWIVAGVFLVLGIVSIDNDSFWLGCMTATGVWLVASMVSAK